MRVELTLNGATRLALGRDATQLPQYRCKAMAMPTRTLPQVTSATVRARPSNAGAEALAAINNAPEMQACDEADDGRIPTQPFGTTAVVVSPAAPKASRHGRESGARFRFLVPTLPTSVRQEQQTGALPSQRANSDRGARPDPLETPSRMRLRLLLGASGVAMLGFVLLVWPDDSDAPEQASSARIAPSAVSRVPQGSPQSATVQAHGTPEIRPQPSLQQNTVPSPAANAAAHPASPTSPRTTVSKALPTLKGESVLTSVLAPPPAD